MSDRRQNEKLTAIIKVLEAKLTSLEESVRKNSSAISRAIWALADIEQKEKEATEETLRAVRSSLQFQGDDDDERN